MNDYASLVDTIHGATANADLTSDTLNSYKQAALEEFSSYQKLIPDFFSTHGEAESIKAMYRKLKELDYARNRLICVIDIPRAASIYGEYFDGMIAFVNDFVDIVNSDSRSNDTERVLKKMGEMVKSIDLAKQADPDFISSLFGGKNGECTYIQLTEAVGNVEYLIDFIPWLEKKIDEIGSFFKKCDCLNCSTEMCTRVLECVKLVSDSLGNYCSKLIKEIFETYLQIMDALNNTVKSSVNVSTGLAIF